MAPVAKASRETNLPGFALFSMNVLMMSVIRSASADCLTRLSCCLRHSPVQDRFSAAIFVTSCKVSSMKGGLMVVIQFQGVGVSEFQSFRVSEFQSLGSGKGGVKSFNHKELGSN